MIDVRIEGAEKLARLSAALKEAGDKGLSKELTKGITRAVKPLKQAAKASAASTLPSRGGLAARVARTTISHTKRGGQSNPGIRLTAKPNAINDPLRLDRGRGKHPVYGRPPWVLQDVTPGWFRKPITEGLPLVQKELIVAMDDVAQKIARSAT